MLSVLSCPVTALPCPPLSCPVLPFAIDFPILFRVGSVTVVIVVIVVVVGHVKPHTNHCSVKRT